MDRIPAPYRRAALWLLCILPALAVTVLLGIAAYFGRMPDKAPQNASALSIEKPEAEIPTVTVPIPPSMEAEDAAFDKADTKNNVINILLIGQDSHEGQDRSRSDSILLCTFHTERRTLTMTSILRDLYVPIPGYRSNRINAAYAAGGMALLEQTMEENFGVTVDGCVEVDFTRFPRLIDLLGGVTLELRADEASAINAGTPGDLKEGECLLSGDQALAYVRIRKLDDDGDFSRTSRQRNLLQALLSAYRNAGITRLLRLLDEALSMVTTNMEEKQIWKTARQLAPILPDLQVIQQHIPAEGTYSYKTIRGMCVLVADLDAARALLWDTVNPEDK